MSPRTEEQNKEIRQEKQQIIMSTALELFSVKGYENTTISDIAKKAGISKGLMYNYFESKEELLEIILNNGIDEMMSIFDPNKDGILEVQELEYFINESFKMIRENNIFWRLYFSIYMQPSAFKLVEKKIDELIGPINEMMTDYFTREGFENPMMETILFGALLDGLTLDYLMKPDLYPFDEVKNELIKRYCRNKKEH